ncbi:hypothetical protein ACHAWF_001360, partial [Thalassiosira exigua]
MVHDLLGPPSSLLCLSSTISDLSAGTEFAAYKDPQWRFLLGGGDVSCFVITSDREEDGADAYRSRFDGCVLKVNLSDDLVGFGMVLVRPSKRRQGYGRALMKQAMGEGTNGRLVLAVCSSLGYPLYRTLGFEEAGSVSLLTCLASDLLHKTHQRRNGGHLTVVDGKECTEEQLLLLASQDARATGFRREGRIRLLLRGYAEGSRSAVAFLSTRVPGGAECISTAVARQD